MSDTLLSSNEKVCQCVRCGRTGDDASEFAKPCGLNGCGGQMHWWPASVRVTLDELTELRARPTHEPPAARSEWPLLTRIKADIVSHTDEDPEDGWLVQDEQHRATLDLLYEAMQELQRAPSPPEVLARITPKGSLPNSLGNEHLYQPDQEWMNAPLGASQPPSDALNERELENFTEIRGWLIAMRETAGLTPTGFGELLGLEVWLTEWIGARRSLSLTKSGCDCNAFPGADEFCTAHKFEPKQRTAGET